MAPPFVSVDLSQFNQVLDEWYQHRKREIDEVHMHHTWRPNHAEYRGHESIVGMWRYHTRDMRWSDIAQHITIDPNGVIWLCRHWDLPPASSRGHNGTTTRGPFMFEMIGDFDKGQDPFKNPQRDVALWVSALVLKRFGLPAERLKFHRELGSRKTCPGSGIDHEEVLAEVRERLGRSLPAKRDKRSMRAASYDPLPTAIRWLSEFPTARPDPDEAEPLEGRAAPRSPAARAPQARAAPELNEVVLSGLRPHVINLSGGQLSTEGLFHSDEGDIRRIFEHELPARIAAMNGRPLPIVLFAHGGLVAEKPGLTIAANQVPWWNANGVYPIQFVWETGLLETLGQMIGLQRAVVGRDLADFTSDPAIEGVVRAAGGGLVWNGMKYAAGHAFAQGGGGAIVIKHLVAFLARFRDKVSLHAVGHSAGSIFHSYMLPALFAADAAAKVDSLSLLAPAITVEAYKQRLQGLVGNKIDRLAMFTMAKDFERADQVAQLYRKSLLYLISGALEPDRGEPILGLEESVRADPDLRRHFGLGTAPGPGEVAWSQTAATSGRRATQSTTHGGFDNDVATMNSVLREVLDLPDAAPLTLSFPPDTESRAARPPAIAAPVTIAPPAAVAAASLPQSPTVVPLAGGTRRAVCIGIDAYPDPRARLHGCVADAVAWAGALSNLGFSVESMHNEAATRAAIVGRLTDLIGSARPGDSLVLQFAGHGTQVDDIDGDEDDAVDEAFCPVDYADGHLIIDDDFKRLFADLRDGVALTCFFDTCHSGTITRLAVGRAPSSTESLPRFLIATPELNALHRQFRAGMGGDRAAAAAAAPATMRQVVFAACAPSESALETSGRGDYSIRAVPLLRNAGAVSNSRFAELVTDEFGSTRRQNPNLDCAPANRDRPFLATGRPERASLPAAGISPDAKEAALADLVSAVRRLI